MSDNVADDTAGDAAAFLFGVACLIALAVVMSIGFTSCASMQKSGQAHREQEIRACVARGMEWNEPNNGVACTWPRATGSAHADSSVSVPSPAP